MPPPPGYGPHESPPEAARSTVCVLRPIWCWLNLLNRVWNLVGLHLLRAIKLEWKLALKKTRYYVYPET